MQLAKFTSILLNSSKKKVNRGTMCIKSGFFVSLERNNCQPKRNSTYRMEIWDFVKLEMFQTKFTGTPVFLITNSPGWLLGTFDFQAFPVPYPKVQKAQIYVTCHSGFPCVNLVLKIMMPKQGSKFNFFFEVDHLQVFSSYCPKFQLFWSHFCVFDQ